VRFLTALGLFLAISGAMVLVLRPVYRVPIAIDVRELETSGSTDETRPIPVWVGVVAIGVGGLLLMIDRRRRGNVRARGSGTRSRR
jgi:hypothetical protein